MRRCRRSVLELERHLVDVAPEPLLTGLIGPDDGVCGVVEVLGRVLAGRLVAAPDVAALLADAQVDPVVVAHGQAVLASRRRRGYRPDVIEMTAANVHAVRNLAGRSEHRTTRTCGAPPKDASHSPRRDPTEEALDASLPQRVTDTGAGWACPSPSWPMPSRGTTS